MERPGNKLAEEPARKRKKTDTESRVNTETGVVNEHYVRCWEEILTYISRMGDIFALLESCLYLRSIVKIHVIKSNPDLIIDDDCLDWYPLAEYYHLYGQIGPLVTTLSVYKVTEQKLHRCSLYFTNIQHLHLERMAIMDPYLGVVYPKLLVSLKLTECAIEKETMNHILCFVNSSLHFHFNKTQIANWTSSIPWKNGYHTPKILRPRPGIMDNACQLTNYADYADFFYAVPKFKQLAHLTLERISCVCGSLTLNGGTESLRIVKCGEGETMTKIMGKRKYLKLKRLSLETSASARDFVENVSQLRVRSLEILTLSHLFTPLEWLRGLKKLKKLTILLPIQTYQEVALTEALSAMDNKIDVKYSVSPKPDINQILNTLNEDCLREVVAYLTLGDTFNLAQADCRFSQLIKSIDLSPFGKPLKIGKEFLARRPLKQHLFGYEAIGHSLSRLKLYCSEDDFFLLAPCFPQLRNLSLLDAEWKWTDAVIEVFPSVEALKMSSNQYAIPTRFMTKLVRKLQPTLRVLHAPNEVRGFEYTQNLYNLNELQICDKFLNEDLRDFWKHNQKLEALCFSSQSETPYTHNVNQDRNWEVIAGLKNLSVLKFIGSFYTGPLPMLRNIKELSLNLLDAEIAKAFLKRTGRQLELLIVFDYYAMKPQEIMALTSGFENLRYFEYNSCEEYTLSVAEVIGWMVQHPLLNVIELTQAPKEFYSDLEDLDRFLLAANRVLYFNGAKHPQ